MDISTFVIYFMMQADSFIGICLATSIITSIVFGGWYIIASVEEAKTRPNPKIFGSVIVIFAFLSAAIPTTKTWVAIYSIPQILQSPEAMALPSNTLKALNKVMKNYINEPDSKNK